MKDPVKIAVIAAIASVVCVALYLYFSPYQSCVRAFKSEGDNDFVANFQCTNMLGGQNR